MMLHISALQSKVVKGRLLFRHSIHAHFTYLVPRGRKTLRDTYPHLKSQDPIWVGFSVTLYNRTSAWALNRKERNILRSRLPHVTRF